METTNDTNVRIPGATHQRAQLAVTLLKPEEKYTVRSFVAEAIEEKISSKGLNSKIDRALNHKPVSTHKATKTQ